jgi:acyl-CoA synthetase (AMP-forming)/AMP-acid ligase II
LEYPSLDCVGDSERLPIVQKEVRMEERVITRAKVWLKSYDTGVPATIDYPPVPLDRLLADSEARHPEAPAIFFGARLGGGEGARLIDRAMSYQKPGQVTVGPGDTACLLYTGGTTGVPKGTQLTHARQPP